MCPVGRGSSALDHRLKGGREFGTQPQCLEIVVLRRSVIRRLGISPGAGGLARRPIDYAEGSTGLNLISLNPGLADYPDFTAGQAVTTAVSPDGATLLVLTSGFNRNIDATGKVIPADSSEYVFVFDITSGRPVQKEVIQIPNTYSGIAFSPDGARFYVSGGKDDSVHTYAESGGSWAESGTPIALGHDHGNGLPQGSNTLPPAAAGLAVTADGKTIVVANYENDSISLVSTTTGTKECRTRSAPG